MMSIAIAKTCGPGRPKDLEKRAAILQAAKQLFTTQGFDGTSMDAIAGLAGVSKLTVYSHYRDKERLFVAAVECVCQEQMPAEIFNADLKGPIRKQLMTIARAFFALITSEAAVAVHRTIVANAQQSPKLGQLFWEAGPKRTQEAFQSFLRERRIALAEVAVKPSTEHLGAAYCRRLRPPRLSARSEVCRRPATDSAKRINAKRTWQPALISRIDSLKGKTYITSAA